jgi:hypothetical protein
LNLIYWNNMKLLKINEVVLGWILLHYLIISSKHNSWTSCLKFTNNVFELCYSILKATSQREMSVSMREREVFTRFQYGDEHVWPRGWMDETFTKLRATTKKFVLVRGRWNSICLWMRSRTSDMSQQQIGDARASR